MAYFEITSIPGVAMGSSTLKEVIAVEVVVISVLHKSVLVKERTHEQN